MDRIQVGALVSRTLAMMAIVLTLSPLPFWLPYLSGPGPEKAAVLGGIVAVLTFAALLWFKAEAFGRLPTDAPIQAPVSDPVQRAVVATTALRILAAFWLTRSLVNIAYSRWANADDPNGLWALFMRDQSGGFGMMALCVIAIAVFGLAPTLGRKL